jgi:hypothetical protein
MPLADQPNRLSWVLRLLEEKELFVPFTSKLNDPFELLLAAYQKRTSSEFASLSNKLNEIQNRSMKAACSFSMGGHRRELLWSHYGHSWKGVRLSFNVLDNHKIYEMNYFDSMDKITEEETHLDILRKLKSWDYEKECRFIHPKEGFYSFKQIGIELVSVEIGIRADKYLSQVIKSKCIEVGISCESVDKILDIYQGI